MNVVIKDLEINKKLDAQAMREVVGGKLTVPRSSQFVSLKIKERKWIPNYKKQKLFG